MQADIATPRAGMFRLVVNTLALLDWKVALLKKVELLSINRNIPMPARLMVEGQLITTVPVVPVGTMASHHPKYPPAVAAAKPAASVALMPPIVTLSGVVSSPADITPQTSFLPATAAPKDTEVKVCVAAFDVSSLFSRNSMVAVEVMPAPAPKPISWLIPRLITAP
jgi:hypothetical protein